MIAPANSVGLRKTDKRQSSQSIYTYGELPELLSLAEQITEPEYNSLVEQPFDRVHKDFGLYAKAERSGEVIKCYCKSLILVTVLFTPVFAQSKNTAPLVDTGPPVSTLKGVLTSTLESRSATAGQVFTLKTISDVMVEGQLIIPKGSRVLGHVTEAVTKGKDQSQSELSLVIEKAVRQDGSEVPLQGIIAALAAPRNDSLSDDPVYGMLHSNEPAQRANAASTVGSGGG